MDQEVNFLGCPLDSNFQLLLSHIYNNTLLGSKIGPVIKLLLNLIPVG